MIRITTASNGWMLETDDDTRVETDPEAMVCAVAQALGIYAAIRVELYEDKEGTR